MKLVAGVSSVPSGGVSGLRLPPGEAATVPVGAWNAARMNKLFSSCKNGVPHWKRVIYDARHSSSIIGFQVQQLAAIRAMVPVPVEFERFPGRWVDVAEYKFDDPNERLAASVAAATWGSFRSASGSQAVAIKQAAEIYGSVGEGYGIEHTGKGGKAAVSIVHCQAVEVQKDGSLLWYRRRGGEPVRVPRANYERLYREDETFVDDCTSPWRHLVDDIMCLQLVNAALRRAAKSDMLLRGLVWAPGNGPNEESTWTELYMDLIEQVERNPEVLGGFMPFPVSSGAKAPEHVDFGSNVHENLIKLHELYVKRIARGSVYPAQLVLEGPGAANAYADHALNRNFLQISVMQDMDQYVYPDIAAWWWHPRLERNAQFAKTGVEACRFRLRGDIARLANRPDSRKEILDARKCGVPFTDDYVAESFGASEADMYQPGTPEYEEFVARQLLFRGGEDKPSGVKELAPGGSVPESDGFTLAEPLGPRFAEVGRLW